MTAENMSLCRATNEKRAQIQLSIERVKLDEETEHTAQAEIARDREAAYWSKLALPERR